MSRRQWILVALTGLFVVTLVMAGILMSQGRAVSAAPQRAPELAPDEQLAVGSYVWSFAAKYVCGYQSPLSATQPDGEPVVKPGNYATDINIHNYNYKQTPLRKKLLVLVQGDQLVAREPQQVQPSKIMTMTLGSDMATMDDCNGLWITLFPGTVPPSPMPLLIGYLVILSPLDLDVDVVYTAEVPGDLTKTGTGIAENVVRVTGKRVFLPSGFLP